MVGLDHHAVPALLQGAVNGVRQAPEVWGNRHEAAQADGLFGDLRLRGVLTAQCAGQGGKTRLFDMLVLLLTCKHMLSTRA